MSDDLLRVVRIAKQAQAEAARAKEVAAKREKERFAAEIAQAQRAHDAHVLAWREWDRERLKEERRVVLRAQYERDHAAYLERIRLNPPPPPPPSRLVPEEVPMWRRWKYVNSTGDEMKRAA